MNASRNYKPYLAVNVSGQDGMENGISDKQEQKTYGYVIHSTNILSKPHSIHHLSKLPKPSNLGFTDKDQEQQGKLPYFTIKENRGPLTYMNITPTVKIQAQRRKLLLDRCHGNENKYLGLSSKNWAYERIQIYNEPKLMYCPLLKVGSTFWRRLLYAMGRGITIHTPYDVSIKKALTDKRANLKNIITSNKTSTIDFLEHSLKMMFVREPYSRLLSGYIDKLFAPNPYFWSVIGKYIVRNFRVNASETSKRCGHDVTFSEFVKYVIYTEEFNKTQRDGHFTPSYDQCKPCQLKYNVIGKMETFIQDTSFVMNSIGFNLSTELYKEWANKAEEDAIFDSSASPFSWKKDIKKCMSMHEAGIRIWRKMQIRGIIDRSRPLPFGSHKMNQVSSTDFIKVLMLTRNQSKHNKKTQKREALIDAFSQLDLDDKNKFKELFLPDFELFDYDSTPSDLFETVNLGKVKTKYLHVNNKVL